MAIRYAIATGNWNATTTWDGGTLPTVGDDVYANGFTVTINQDIQVDSITTKLNPLTSISGGLFIVATTVNRLLTCTVEAGTSICLRIDNGNARTTIIGNIIGGTVANSPGLYLNSTTVDLSVQPIIYGNVIGGSASGCHGLTARGDRPQQPTIYGNILAGSAASGLLLSLNQTTASVTVYGNITANGAIGCVSGGLLYIFGSVTSSNNFYGAQSSLIAYASGILNNSAGYWAVYSPRLYVSTAQTIEFKLNEQTTGNDIILYSSNSFVGMPLDSDVRQGTTYGPGSSLTGTLKVPPASSVAVGVPVDNTIGTAIISITDMGALLASYNV